MGKNNFGESFGKFDCTADSYNTWKIVVRPEGDVAIAELYRDGVKLSSKSSAQVVLNTLGQFIIHYRVR